MKKITADEFKDVIELNPLWAASLTENVEVTTYCNMSRSPIQSLSPHLHFTGKNSFGEVANFTQCENIKVAEGVYYGAVVFEGSSIEKIGDIIVKDVDDYGWAAIFQECDKLEIATGKYPGAVSFDASGIKEIKNLEVTGKNKDGVKALFLFCSNLKSVEEKYIQEGFHFEEKVKNHPSKEITFLQQKTHQNTDSQSKKIKTSAIDTETGGTNPSTDGLISIAIIAPNGREFYRVIKHTKTLNYKKEALAINGFELKNDGGKTYWVTKDSTTGKETIEEGVLEEDAIIEAVDFLERNCKNSMIAGVNLSFDVNFLTEAAKRVDEKLGGKLELTERFEKAMLRKKLEVQTLAIAAHLSGKIKLEPSKADPTVPNVALKAIAEATEVSDRETKEHNALEDARITLNACNVLQNLLLDNNIKISKKEKIYIGIN